MAVSISRRPLRLLPSTVVGNELARNTCERSSKVRSGRSLKVRTICCREAHCDDAQQRVRYEARDECRIHLRTHDSLDFSVDQGLFNRLVPKIDIGATRDV